MAAEQATATSTTSADPSSDGSGDWVRLNVGGTVFETTRSSLTRLNSEFLDRLLAEDSGFPPPADGVYRIDRDPEVFRVLLNFARNGRLLLSPQVTSEMVLADADFYMLRQGALEAIEELGKGATGLARRQGRRILVAEVSIQHVERQHHNALIFSKTEATYAGYVWRTRCPVEKCPAKVFDEKPEEFTRMCIW
ncbi:SH3KBP1-binding protein 1-like [Branchiostoma floridae x Branchiostoma belcheri]